jgi:hypothetical protein
MWDRFSACPAHRSLHGPEGRTGSRQVGSLTHEEHFSATNPRCKPEPPPADGPHRLPRAGSPEGMIERRIRRGRVPRLPSERPGGSSPRTRSPRTDAPGAMRPPRPRRRPIRDLRAIPGRRSGVRDDHGWRGWHRSRPMGLGPIRPRSRRRRPGPRPAGLRATMGSSQSLRPATEGAMDSVSCGAANTSANRILEAVGDRLSLRPPRGAAAVDRRLIMQRFDDVGIRSVDPHDPDGPLVATPLSVGPLAEHAVAPVDLVAGRNEIRLPSGEADGDVAAQPSPKRVSWVRCEPSASHRKSSRESPTLSAKMIQRPSAVQLCIPATTGAFSRVSRRT